MKVISINVGQPREITWRDETITTSIFKSPVNGAAQVLEESLEGDRQADRTVHGGPTKSIYGYPAEHYEFWRTELGPIDLPWGIFGENLTTAGLSEEDVCVGDVFQIGNVELVATEPRIPCFKLNARFQRSDMVKRFTQARRSGFYFGVRKQGLIEAGHAITQLSRDPAALTIREVADLNACQRGNVELLEKAIATSALSDAWRTEFRQQLQRIQGKSGKSQNGG